VDLADARWDFFQAATIVLMLVVTSALFPYSKTMFLAFDVWVRPPTQENFIVPHEETRVVGPNRR
jgi:hypothetical protein